MKTRVVSILLSVLLLVSLAACSQEKRPRFPDSDAGRTLSDAYDTISINHGDKDVYADILLPNTCDQISDVKITWRLEGGEDNVALSEPWAYISRPAVGEKPVAFKLTATISHQDASVEMPFDLQVMPMKEVEVYHVAKDGSDKNPGTLEKPFLTINKAAQIADAGDTVIIGGGTYREYVDPARGGRSENARITYKAKEGEQVIIKGSDALTNLKPEAGKPGVYSQKMDKAAFGGYNPYTIAFMPVKNATLGEVFVDGVPYSEASSLDSVASQPNSWKADETGEKIYVNMGETDPENALVEYNVRQQVFAPSRYGLGYITVDGLTIEHAANQYPITFYLPGYPSQMGALGTVGGHHWIIENCSVGYAKSINVEFGYGGEQIMIDKKVSNLPRTYYENKTGFHIIRNNNVYSGGTNGLLAIQCPDTIITGNTIVDNNRFDVEVGYEAAGLKTFYLTNSIIADNFFSGNKYVGLWVDNTAVNCRVTGNVFVDHPDRGMTAEMLTGSLTIDSNVFIKSKVQFIDAMGIRFANNLSINSGMGFDLLMERDTTVIPPFTQSSASSVAVGLKDIGVYKNYFSDGGVSIPAENKAIGGNFSANNLFADKALNNPGVDQNCVIADGTTLIEYDVTQRPFTIKFTPVAKAFEINPNKPDWVDRANLITGAPYDTEKNQDFFGNEFTNQSIAGPFASLVPGENTITLFPKPARPQLIWDKTFINNNSASVTYSEGCELLTDRWLGDYGGDVLRAANDGDTITITTNQHVKLIGVSGPDAPVIEISVNGKVVNTITASAPEVELRSLWFEFTRKGNGEYTITLKKVGGGEMLFDGYFVSYLYG